MFKTMLVLILYLSSAIYSQNVLRNENYKLYSTDELESDLNFLVQTISDVHPNIYVNIDSISFNADLEKVKAALKDSMTSLKFFNLMAPVICKIIDAHTMLDLPWDEYEKYQKFDGRFFPYIVDYFDGIRITGYRDTINKLPIGTNLLKINDIDCASLLNKFLANRGFERKDYGSHIATHYFKYYLWVNQILPPYKIEYEDQNNNIQITEINSFGENKFTSEYKYYDYNVLKGNIAYINYRACYNDKNNPFEDFLISTFSDIKEKNCKGLIIDLRKNPGGSTNYAEMLIEYLTDKPYKFCSEKNWKVSGIYKDYLRGKWPFYVSMFSYKPLVWISELFMDEAGYFTKDENSILKIMFNENIPADNTNKFKGKICLLVSNETFSTAVDFADAVKTYKIAKIFGCETGGVPNGFGESYHFELPNTKLYGTVSSARFVRADGDITNNNGVVPDYYIKNSIYDIITNKDAVLNKAIGWINNE